MSAFDLKRISGIHRRDPSKAPAEDIGIQRRHMPERSDEILRYLLDGFPLSRINKKTLVDATEATSLRMPGWIPTAIIANILAPDDRRGAKGATVPKADLVKLSKNNGTTELVVPDHCLKDDWTPVVHPIEIIDGQHRLWALEEPADGDDVTLWTADFKRKIRELQIPVVAFYGLDRTWQAYLFYTINQLPKRIDTSLVFDLYPLLRTEEWLLRFEGPEIYRETRAQDLAIILWSHPDSPWKDRILRLGGRERGKVTQASLIRSLMASFIKRYRKLGTAGVGGLFGAPVREHKVELGWAREQQAAFLILAWQSVRDAIRETKAKWAEDLRRLAAVENDEAKAADAPFSGEQTLLASDQGSRCILLVMNDMFWVSYESGRIDLNKFQWERRSKHTEDGAVSDALKALRNQLPAVQKLADEISTCLAEFDWRAFSAVKREDQNYDRQSSYRGSGGYRALRHNALEHLRNNGSRQVSQDAGRLIELLRLEEDESAAE